MKIKRETVLGLVDLFAKKVFSGPYDKHFIRKIKGDHSIEWISKMYIPDHNHVIDGINLLRKLCDYWGVSMSFCQLLEDRCYLFILWDSIHSIQFGKVIDSVYPYLATINFIDDRIIIELHSKCKFLKELVWKTISSVYGKYNLHFVEYRVDDIVDWEFSIKDDNNE